MHETDTAAHRHLHDRIVVLDVSVPRLYVSAVRVCARANPDRHGPWLERLAHTERALPTGRYDSKSTAAMNAAQSRVRAYVADNEDVAAEAQAIMDRLAALLLGRGAQIIARDPTTVRCTKWWHRRQDWMDAAILLGHPGRPHTVGGLLFGPDYAASVHIVRAVGVP